MRRTPPEERAATMPQAIDKFGAAWIVNGEPKPF
jgi:hypothetical protein